MKCDKCNNEIKDESFIIKGKEEVVYCYDCAHRKAHRGSDRKKKLVVFIERNKLDRWAFCKSCHTLMQIDKNHNICNFCYLDLKKRGIEI